MYVTSVKMTKGRGGGRKREERGKNREEKEQEERIGVRN